MDVFADSYDLVHTPSQDGSISVYTAYLPFMYGGKLRQGAIKDLILSPAHTSEGHKVWFHGSEW